jgi:membrane fusion protein, multidrug efflux system
MKPSLQRKKIIITFISILVLAGAGIGYYLYTKNKVYTNNAYILGHSSYVSPHIAGYVNKIRIKDNQFVKSNELLVEIDPTPFQEDINECQAKLNVAKAQLDADIQLKEIASAKLEFALLQYKRYKYLSETHAESLETYQTFNSNLNQEKANFKAKLMKIELDKAAIEQARANLSIAKINFSYTKIRAPFDGWITKKTVTVGNYVAQGEALMAIVPQNLYIEANYKETKLTHIRKGQPVSIHIDSYPNATFKGHVDSVQSGSGAAFSLLPPENATGNFVKIVQRIPVKILFDKRPDPKKYKLSVGMSVETTIRIDKKA